MPKPPCIRSQGALVLFFVSSDDPLVYYLCLSILFPLSSAKYYPKYPLVYCMQAG
jgi:hypothetical protein